MSLPSTREIPPPVLDYASNVQEEALYRYYRASPQSGASSLTLTNGGGEQCIFDVNNTVFNLSRSYLSFDAAPTAGSGGTKFNWIYAHNLAMIRSVSLTTRGQVYLADVQNVAQYTNIIGHLVKKYTQFKNTTSNLTDYGELHPCDADDTANPNAVTALGKPPPRIYSDAVCRLLVGGDNTATPVLNVRIPLKELVHSLFAQDKDLFLNQITELKVVFNATTQFIWFTGDATDPVTGATAYAGNVSLTDIKLYLAEQKNENIRNALMSAVLTTGVSYVYPWVHAYSQALTGTSQSILRKFNRTHGKSLKMIFHALANSAGNLNVNYDISNDSTTTYGTSKWTACDVYLNSQRLNDEPLTAALHFDQLKNSGLLTGSIAEAHRGYFLINNAVVYSWCKEKSLSDVDWNDDSGIELSSDIDFDLKFTTTGAFTHHQFAVCSRVLNVSAQGVAVF